MAARTKAEAPPDASEHMGGVPIGATAATSAPPAVAGWWAVAVFSIAGMLSYTDRYILTLLVDPLRADLHLSDTQFSVLQGMAFAFIYSFAGLPLGRLADVIPRRAVIVTGVVIWSAATVSCGFAHSFTQLLLCRALVGIGEATLAPAAISMIGDYFVAERRGFAVGCLLTGMNIGAGMAIAVGGGLLQLANDGFFHGLPVLGALVPWRSVLVALGLPGVAVALLLFTVIEPARAASAHGTGAVSLKAVGHFAHARRGFLMPLYLGLALLAIGDFAMANWTPALLSRKFGVQPGEIGSVLGSIAIFTGIVSTAGGGWVSDRSFRAGGTAGRLRLCLAACAMSVILAGIGFAGNEQMVLVLYFGWTLAIGFATAVGITALPDVVPAPMRGLGIATASFCNILLGLGFGTTVTALLTDHVFGDSAAVGLSVTAVASPAAGVAALLFARAAAAARASASGVPATNESSS